MEKKDRDQIGGQSRKEFLSTVALGAVGTFSAASILSGCSGSGRLLDREGRPLSSLREQAPDGEPLRAGLIGCGGRGTGAAINYVDAGPNLEVVALADVFEDQVDRCRANLNRARGIEIPDRNCHFGLDAYKKVIDSDIDVVLMASPPFFRPEQVRYAVDAGVHIFQEKPVAVDPHGSTRMEEITRRAREKGLCMVSGTVRRYQKDYIETRKRVEAGVIGEVTGATIVRNGGALWWVARKPEWSDLEYMLRNWGNYNWLSGDHIVEMFIHEIDVMSWYFGGHPESAVGYGGRQRRQSGDLYDHFSIVYRYSGGRRATCTVRQINGCDNGKEELINGTEGYVDASGTIYNMQGESVWRYPYPRDHDPDQSWSVQSPYVQELVQLVTAIRTGAYINDSDEQIKSTRISIMGRMAAYTGREITWNEILESDLRLGPDRLDFAQIYTVPEAPPVPGMTADPVDRYA